jgi:hypothetical protein
LIEINGKGQSKQQLCRAILCRPIYWTDNKRKTKIFVGINSNEKAIC